MGQQYSATAATEDVSVTTPCHQATSSSNPGSSEGKTRVDRYDPRHMPSWRHMASRYDQELADGGHQSKSTKTDLGVNRMSIRAAIDTFIENCLSANSDGSPRADELAGEDSQGSGLEEAAKDSRGFPEVGQIVETCPSVVAEDHRDDTSALAVVQASSVLSGSSSGAESLRASSAASEDLIVINNDHQLEQKEAGNENGGQQLRDTEAVEKNVKTCSPTSLGPQASHLTTAATTEKQTFCAFLQERLKKIDLEKHAELSELALNKDIQSHEQMLMWEMRRKPADVVEIPGPPNVSGVLNLRPGPVRLQTVIDRVLDNSLRNQDPHPGVKFSRRAGDTPKEDVAQASSCEQPCAPEPCPTANPELEDKSKPGPSNTTRLCFKDHIEKVLIENFKLFEEEERLESLKLEAANKISTQEDSFKSSGDKDTNIPSLYETANAHKAENSGHESGGDNKNKAGSKAGLASGSMGAGGKDGTISVQDIVDQVISQTEVISKLNPPPAGEQTLHPRQPQHHGPHTLSQYQPRAKYQTSSIALLEAQKQVVQKEHQSSTNMGRKRGRPRLGSPIQSKQIAETAKDRLVHQDGRGVQMMQHRGEAAHLNQSNMDPSSAHHMQLSNPSGLSASANSKLLMSPAMFQQSHHSVHKTSSPSIGGKPLSGPVSSAEYHVSVHDGYHHQRAAAQYLSGMQPHHPHAAPSHSSAHLATSKAPPPLLLVDRVKDSSAAASSGHQMMSSHIPYKSCSCHDCLSQLSQGNHASYMAHSAQHSKPHLYHQCQTQVSRSNTGEYYSQHSPSIGETHVQVFISDKAAVHSTSAIPTTFAAAHRQPKEIILGHSSGDSYRDTLHNSSNSGHYHSSQVQVSHEAHITKQYLMDSDLSRHKGAVPTPNNHYEHRGHSHLSGDHLPGKALPGLKAEFSPFPAASTSQETQCPLDLSVKSYSGPNHEARLTFDSSGRDAAASSPYRSGSDQHPRDCHLDFKADYRLEKKPDYPLETKPDYRLETKPDYRLETKPDYRLETKLDYHLDAKPDYHLQRLEQSLDRFMSSHQQPQPALHSSRLAQPLQSAPNIGQRGRVLHSQHSPGEASFLEQAHEQGGLTSQGGSGHLQPSSVGYVLSPSTAAPGHLQPSSGSYLLSPSSAAAHKTLISPVHSIPTVSESASTMQYHSRTLINQPVKLSQPKVTDASLHRQAEQGGCNRSGSFTGYQHPPHQDPAGYDHGVILIDSVRLPSPHGQLSPSTEDPQKLSVCKHEPIQQNIIGNHAASDILYLICRLCRQTYGSLYGFRKHFRNQHGTEPKADHTIVQTISATKSAMADVGPVELPHRLHQLQVSLDDRLPACDMGLHDQMVTAQSSNISASPAYQLSPAEGNLTDLPQDFSAGTKCLECSECGQTFQLNDFGSYKRHCRQHSLHRSSGPFACHECERTFSEPGHLQDHLKTHSSFTASVCGICRTFFSSPQYLAVHLQAAHGLGTGGEKPTQTSESVRASEVVKNLEAKEDSALITESSRIKTQTSISDIPTVVLPPSLSQTAVSLTSSHSATPSPSSHPVPSLLEQHRSASASSALPISKRHHYSLPSSDANMLTVHTPKGLEVQKLPADAVVTTASPDSSYDDARCSSDSQPASSSVTQSEKQEDSRETRVESGNTCSETKTCDTFSNPKYSLSSSHSDRKEDTESGASERSHSAESANVSLGSSRASSPATSETDTYYIHKKYNRYKKRSIDDPLETEPKAKILKPDTVSTSQKKDFSSVSSSVTSCVTVQDCQSSIGLTERVSPHKGKRNDGGLPTPKLEQSQESKAGKLETCLGSADSVARKAVDEGNKSKWDRQTRSQMSKSS